MAQDLLVAFALVLVLEGLLPALRPGTWRQTVEQLANLPDAWIRRVGIGMLVAGGLLFHLVR
ncbi:MAG: DUF2065 domain-containing protein [Gammaproteobacteria bacterium HGW-Gammaproteobacteria-8]|nr:MAG: DUF2065 domain-containing protein [Gammaproteobacteria bacterium HGW-Gammaproteobacteria-8]